MHRNFTEDLRKLERAPKRPYVASAVASASEQLSEHFGIPRAGPQCTYAIKLSDTSTRTPRTRCTVPLRASHRAYGRSALAGGWGLLGNPRKQNECRHSWGEPRRGSGVGLPARRFLHIALHSACRLHPSVTPHRRLGLRHRYHQHLPFRLLLQAAVDLSVPVLNVNRKKDCVRTYVRGHAWEVSSQLT